MSLNYCFKLCLAFVLCGCASTLTAFAQSSTDVANAPLTTAPPIPTPTPTPSPKPKPTQTRDFLKDRGMGMSTSIFGTYVRRGELIVYPFYEHYRDRNFEYKPEELSAVGDKDFRGRYRANETLIFVAYGITDNLSFEMEAATIKATFDKSPADTSGLPKRIVESGLGDVEGQLRWRWRKEDDHRPEIFSYAELVIPHHKRKVLIGTSGVELKFGTGIIRGFSWGTVTARAAVEYTAGSTSKYDLGEYAVEYLKRLSPKWRLFVGIEGKQDELSLIPELQWHVHRNVFVKFNSGVGLTSRATDWTPEIGIVFTIPTR